MTSGQRATVAVSLMAALSQLFEVVTGLSKADFRTAVDATDQWASDNASSYNSALPTAARNALTAPQKARLLAAVVLARHQNGV